MTNENFEAAALFDEDDLGFDKAEANTLLDLRERFDSLPLSAQASLGEALVRVDARTLEIDGDPDEHDYVDEALTKFKQAELDKAAEVVRGADSKCGLCDRDFEEGDVILERQTVWVTPGSNQVQMREDTRERAHGSCVKRVKEGGSAEPGLF